MRKHLLMRGLNFLYSKPSSTNPNYKTHSLSSYQLHTSNKPNSSLTNPNSQHNPENENHDLNPADVDDVSSEELKTQIDKFYKGDFEAIPTIFESILKRKLAGKHEDSDDELMNEFRRDRPDEIKDDEEFDQSSSSGSDSDSDK